MSYRFYEAILGLVILLAIGTIIFQQVEGWSWVDSFYFTGVTMLTIGYGDLTPSHDLSKILTVLFGIGSISLVFYALTAIGGEVARQLGNVPRHLAFRNHRHSHVPRHESRHEPNHPAK